MNRVACSVGSEEGLNDCGQCGSLQGQTGDACGTCGSGTLTCDGAGLSCEGEQTDLRNACGGCGSLPAEPGDNCGRCLTWECVSIGSAGEQWFRCVPDTSLEDCEDLVTCEDLDCGAQNRGCVETDGHEDAECADCLQGFREELESCQPVAACADLECDTDGRICHEGEGDEDAACGECMTGYREEEGACVMTEGCADLDCGALNRTCEEGAGDGDATCGACLGGYRDEEGTCEEIVTCTALDCGSENRTCVPSSGDEDAFCGACLGGYRDEEGACEVIVTCTALDCGSENRTCVPSSGDEDAFCGECTEGYRDEEGACEVIVTCTDLDCESQERECVEASGDEDATCGDCLGGYRDEEGTCEVIVTCTDLDCGTENRLCEPETSDSDASCGACASGYRDEGGTCVIIEGCADLDCGALNRTCEEGVGEEDATCGACLGGYRDEGGTCELIVTCTDLDCGALNRTCEEGVGEEDATCGACLGGYRDEGGTCELIVTCTDLDCGSENRLCVPTSGDDDAFCGECVMGYRDDDGTCETIVTCSDLDCGSQERECMEASGDEDATCGDCLAGYRDEEGTCELIVMCSDLDCGSENRLCVPSSADEDAFCGECAMGYEEVGGQCIGLLPVPTGVSATQGTDADFVEVSWDSVSMATGYHVYRDGIRATDVPVSGTTWQDPDAPPAGAPGVVQSLTASDDEPLHVRLDWSPPEPVFGSEVGYRVRAVNEDQESERSGEVTGWRAGEAISAYEVRREEGDWFSVGTSEVLLDDEAPPGTIELAVPSATTDRPDGVLLGSDEPVIVPGPEISYQVRAVTGDDQGEPSVPAAGRRSVGDPAFQWVWSSSEEGTTEPLDDATDLTFLDEVVSPGESRWYRLTATAEGAANTESVAVVGARTLPPSLGSPCTEDTECPAGTWCPDDSSDRRCAPRPTYGDIELAFQFVPGASGPFLIGSVNGDSFGFQTNEEQVSVELTRHYFVQRTPVTNGQWREVIETWNALDPAERQMTGWSGATPEFGTAPSYFSAQGLCSDDDCPVETLNWYDAVVFANVLSLLEGLEPCYVLDGCTSLEGTGAMGGGCMPEAFCGVLPGDDVFECEEVSFVGASCTGYRLPTEAEWEYAARAGTTTATYGGNVSSSSGCAQVSGAGDIPWNTPLADLAWYNCNANERTHPVGSLLPNAWGLFDVLGNVSEYAWNRYSVVHHGGIDPLGAEDGTARAMRGGGIELAAEGTRAARRFSNFPERRTSGQGMRLVRSALPDPGLDCGAPPEAPEGGSLTLEGTDFQDVASYSCDPGYGLAGVDTLVCTASGAWTAGTIDCITCGLPPNAPENGQLLDDGPLVPGAEARYVCDEGYVLEGNALGIWTLDSSGTGELLTVVACGEDGNQSGAAPDCVPGCSSNDDCGAGEICPDTEEMWQRRCMPAPAHGDAELSFGYVPAGHFVMGSHPDEVGRTILEEQAEVWLSQGIHVQQTPLTIAQWSEVIATWNALPASERQMSGWTGATPEFERFPSRFLALGTCTDDNCPVERVSWWDALVFANVLSLLEGLEPCYELDECVDGTGYAAMGGGCTGTGGTCGGMGMFECSSVSFAGLSCNGYRLPTEAEWEFAARATTTTATYNGDLPSVDCVAAMPVLDPIAWSRCNSSPSGQSQDLRTHPVGLKAPNLWDLFDTLGNVEELTWNRHVPAPEGGFDPLGPSSGSSVTRKGGSYVNFPNILRAAFRAGHGLQERVGHVGFRLVRTATP